MSVVTFLSYDISMEVYINIYIYMTYTLNILNYINYSEKSRNAICFCKHKIQWICSSCSRFKNIHTNDIILYYHIFYYYNINTIIIVLVVKWIQKKCILSYILYYYQIINFPRSARARDYCLHNTHLVRNLFHYFQRSRAVMVQYKR